MPSVCWNLLELSKRALVNRFFRGGFFNFHPWKCRKGTLAGYSCGYKFNNAPIRTFMFPGFLPVRTSQNGCWQNIRHRFHWLAYDAFPKTVRNTKKYQKIPPHEYGLGNKGFFVYLFWRRSWLSQYFEYFFLKKYLFNCCYY